MDISHVPHVQTVVIINTAEPLAGRVKGHSNGIWVASAHLGGKKVADGKEIRDFFVKQISFPPLDNTRVHQGAFAPGVEPFQGEDHAPPASPRLRDGSSVPAKRVRPRQRADELQFGGLEDVHSSISTPAEDAAVRQRQRVGRARLEAGRKCLC